MSLNEIKERKVPELNDEFAQKVGPFKTVDDLKADIQKVKVLYQKSVELLEAYEEEQQLSREEAKHG